MSDTVEQLDNKGSPLVRTADGTVTLRDETTGELYHNSGGAYLEALENYARPARWQAILAAKEENKKCLRLLDVCFGLGYNTFVLLDQLARSQCGLDAIEVLAIEKNHALVAILPAILQQDCFINLRHALKSDKLFDFSEDETFIAKFHIGNGIAVTLKILFSDLRTLVPTLSSSEPEQYDLVFHDPFSPARVPELWTVDLFAHYFALLNPNWGRVLTYSAASAVRGGLKEAGFAVYRTAGVGRKSGGTLGLRHHLDAEQEKNEFDGAVFPLYEAELERLHSRSGIPYRDPTLNADRQTIRNLREDEQKQTLSVRANQG